MESQNYNALNQNYNAQNLQPLQRTTYDPDDEYDEIHAPAYQIVDGNQNTWNGTLDFLN